MQTELVRHNFLNLWLAQTRQTIFILFIVVLSFLEQMTKKSTGSVFYGYLEGKVLEMNTVNHEIHVFFL